MSQRQDSRDLLAIEIADLELELRQKRKALKLLGGPVQRPAERFSRMPIIKAALLLLQEHPDGMLQEELKAALLAGGAGRKTKNDYPHIDTSIKVSLKLGSLREMNGRIFAGDPQAEPDTNDDGTA